MMNETRAHWSSLLAIRVLGARENNMYGKLGKKCTARRNVKNGRLDRGSRGEGKAVEARAEETGSNELFKWCEIDDKSLFVAV